MSSELRMMINKSAIEERERHETDLEKGMDRYKSLLLSLVKDRKLDVVYSVEGSETSDSRRKDFEVLERAGLVKGQTKYTHRNEYRQYELTAEGEKIAEKLSKES